MKKKLLSIAFVAAIAATAGLNFNQNENKVTLSNLAFANVEALANSEADDIVANCRWNDYTYCNYIVVTHDGSTIYSHYNLKNNI